MPENLRGDFFLTHTVYNNVGLISYGAEDVASVSSENRRFRLPHCRLTPHL